MKKCSIKYLLVLALFALVPCAFAATINVSSYDLVDGKLPLGTIVANANEGDEIVIADGTYQWNTTVEINKGIILRSASGNPADVILQRASDWISMKVNHANAVIKDLTIKATQTGNTSPLINFPQNGAGGEVRNCIIEGGTTYTTNSSNITLKSPGLISHCIIKGVQYRGSCNGVAIQIAHEDAVVRNCVITGNKRQGSVAASPFGTVYISAGTLESCTIAGNATPQYSGVYATEGVVRNCLIGSNTQTSNGIDNGLVNVQAYNSGNATFEYCVVPNPIAGSNIHVVLDPFVDENYRPAAVTSVLNAGLDQTWMKTAKDLDGNDRILNGTVDIGAYESVEMPDTAPAGKIQIQGVDLGLAPFDVTFIANLENCGATKDLTCTWTFGDGAVSNITGSAMVTHRFTEIGEWNISLTVNNAQAGVNAFTLPETATARVTSPTIYVAPYEAENVTPVWPYRTRETASLTLREAVNAAVDTCEIVLLKGTHLSDALGTIYLNCDVTIRGETGKPEDVVFCYGNQKTFSQRFFEIARDSAELRDFVLDGTSSAMALDWTEGNGRLVYLQAGGLVTNCILRNATATTRRNSGAAVYIGNGGGTVSHCVISNNCIGTSDSNVGSYYCVGSAVCMNSGRLVDCLLTGNFVKNGSMLNTGGTVAISGGEVVNCTIVGNSAYDCAGVYAIGSNGKVINTLIANNVSEYEGEDATATAAVWKGQNATDNSIFTHCFSDTLKINDNCPDFGDPLFKDAANGDYRLTADSPCVNAGTGEEVTLSATDLAGNPRVQNRRVDIGCYETLSRGFSIIMR